MTQRTVHPSVGSAEVHVLINGYVDIDQSPRSVASTVTYVRDGDARIIVDPGLVASPASILDPLRDNGVSPDDIRDVVFSTTIPTTPSTRRCSPTRASTTTGRSIATTPGSHAPPRGSNSRAPPAHRDTRTCPQDITTLVRTPEGTAALTHLWWTPQGPSEDPFASDGAALHAGRVRVLGIATLIIPGHGAPFTPDSSTPR